MGFLQVLEALGGLGLFVFGMKTMADGLQRLAGGKFRRLVERLTGNRLSAALTGSCLTSLLQSSGAASILIIGFVNAGLLSLFQALGMLVGAGLGTAFAVQFIAFRVTLLSLPVVFAGVLLRLYSTRRRLVFLGDILLGFGLLFFGLEIMESRFAVLGGSLLADSSRHYLLQWHGISVLLGALLTVVVQSGSAAIGIIIALAVGGIVAFDQAAAMVVGEILGTVFLAGIGVIGGSLTAKRTVLFYGFISGIALLLVLLFFPWYLRGIFWVTSWTTAVPLYGPGAVGSSGLSGAAVARALANGYTLFILFLTVIFVPCIGFFARSAGRIFPFANASATEPRSQYLDFRVFTTPSLALLQAGNELMRMAQVTHSMVSDCISQLYDFSARRSTVISQKENLLDVVQKELSSYLVELARQPLTAEIATEIPVFLAAVNSFESIGDCCESVQDCLRRKKEENVYFSHNAMDELKGLAGRASCLTALAVDSLGETEPPSLDRARTLHREIVAEGDVLKANHLSRLSNGSCTVLAGLLFMDIVAAFVRVADHALACVERGKVLHS